MEEPVKAVATEDVKASVTIRKKIRFKAGAEISAFVNLEISGDEVLLTTEVFTRQDQ